MSDQITTHLQKNRASKNSILRRTRVIEVEGVGEILLRPLPAGVVIDLQKQFAGASSDTTVLFSVLMKAVGGSMVDDEGQRLFSIEEESDIPFDLLLKLQEPVMDMIGLEIKGKKSAEVEALVDPLDAIQSADSPIDSLSE